MAPGAARAWGGGRAPGVLREEWGWPRRRPLVLSSPSSQILPSWEAPPRTETRSDHKAKRRRDCIVLLLGVCAVSTTAGSCCYSSESRSLQRSVFSPSHVLVCHNCHFLNLADRLSRHRFPQSLAEPRGAAPPSHAASPSSERGSAAGGGVVLAQLSMRPPCSRPRSSPPRLTPSDSSGRSRDGSALDYLNTRPLNPSWILCFLEQSPHFLGLGLQFSFPGR